MFISHKIALPDFSKAPTHTSSVLGWLWYFIRPHRNLFIFLTINRLGRQIFFLGLQPLFIARLIASFENGDAYRDPDALWLKIALFAIVSAVIYLLLFVCTEEAKLHDLVSREARLLGLAHLNQLSVDWHEQADSGTKLQKITAGTTGIQNLLRLYFQSLLAILASAIGTGIAVTGIGLPWPYIVMFGGLIGSYCIFAWWAGRYVTRGYDWHNTLLEKLIGKVYEFVNAAQTVKLFSLSHHILERAKSGEQEGHEQISKTYLLDYAYWCALDFVALFWIIAILATGIHQSLNHIIGTAALALAAYQTLKIWDALENFTSVYNQILEHSSASQRLITLLRQPLQPDIARPLVLEKGEITFNDICFAYNAGDEVLKGINLTIKAGEKIGIVGHSGSGKSTLAKLLLRFYDPNENEILIDRQNIRLVNRDSLYQNIAVIPQDVTIFNHTILDNIRCGRLDASDEEVMQAAKHAFAHEFIQKLPEGYHTIVGERGTRLSGGQRQRLAIARAILKKAPILILDEATSALDSESEHFIQSSLHQMFASHTVIAIAHRLSTLREMDRLIVLHEGRIVESGTHQELLEQNGSYAQLWSLQTGRDRT